MSDSRGGVRGAEGGGGGGGMRGINRDGLS